MTVIFIFIFGLIIGSFLNAVICRLKENEQFVRGRSKCPYCRHSLGFWDLIPLASFIFLKARCRYCHKKISWQYPLVELATALVFTIGYFHYQFPNYLITLLPYYLIYLVFSCFLIIIFVYDLKHYLILDKVTLPALILALALNFLLGLSIINLLIAALVAAGFFFLQFIVSKGKWIGGGDLRLGLVMGAMLGWPKVALALMLAYVLGAAIGIFLIILKKKQLNSPMPFGTFLSLGTWVALLWSEEIWHFYSSIISNK